MFSFNLSFIGGNPDSQSFLFYLFSFLIPVYCVLEERFHRDEMVLVQTLSRTQVVLGRLAQPTEAKAMTS